MPAMKLGLQKAARGPDRFVRPRNSHRGSPLSSTRNRPFQKVYCDAHHSIPFGKVGCGLTTGGSLGGNFVAGQTYRDHAPPFEGRVSWLACRLMAVALMSLSGSDRKS